MNQKEFIKECFKELQEKQPSVFLTKDKYGDEIYVADSMKLKEKIDEWKLIKNNISIEDIEKLEKKYSIKFPTLYKEFLMSYYFNFPDLEGYFNDKKVGLCLPKILPEQKNKKLIYLESYVDMYCNRVFVNNGYIPIGIFHDMGLICFNANENNVLVCFNTEEMSFEITKEDLEYEKVYMFKNFEELLRCFFCKEIYDYNPKEIEFYGKYKEIIEKAESGDAEAQKDLGELYYMGRYVRFYNDKKAEEWLIKSAKQGNFQAIADLGELYMLNIRENKNYEETLKIVKYAAEKGDALAAYNMGVIYIAGLGVKKDENEAKKWFSLGADRGYSEAKVELDAIINKKG